MTLTTAPARANRYPAACADCRGWVLADKGSLTKSPAGKWETRHAGTCPAPTARPANAAPGYYIRSADGKAVVVVAGKRNPERTYGKVLTYPADGSRPSWVYTPGAGYSVADLTPLAVGDAAALGLAHGYCIFCCAALGPKDPAKPTLSALCSALIGYGEICAGHHALPYPKGVAAQRAFLAEHGK